MLAGNLRQRAAVAQVVDHHRDRALQRNIFRLVTDDLHCFGDGDTGPDEDRELTREVHQLLLLDLLLRQFEVERAALFLDLHRIEVLIQQGSARITEGVGFGHAFDGRTCGVDGGICEPGHFVAPSWRKGS